MTHEEKDKILAEQDEKIAQQEAANADLQAQNAELLAKLAELEASNAAKTEAEKVEPEKVEPEKNVRINLYKDERHCNDQEVFVNGRPYLIQRGVDVDVPASVAEVLRNRQMQQNRIAAYNAKMTAK